MNERLLSAALLGTLVVELLAVATYWMCVDRGMDDIALYPFCIVCICVGVFAGYIAGDVARFVGKRKKGER